MDAAEKEPREDELELMAPRPGGRKELDTTSRQATMDAVA